MILFFNIKITSQRYIHYHRNSWLPDYDRLDVFKYCLASHTPLRRFLKKAIFYLEMGQEFEYRKTELEEFIRELYPNCELYWYRNDNVYKWREACAEHFADDDIIWYGGNDDHIFMDYDLDVVDDIVRTLKNDPDPMAVVYYSHWAEMCRTSKNLNGTLTESGNLVKFTWKNFDAIHVLKGSRFKFYWQDPRLEHHQGDLLHRSDVITPYYDFYSNFYAPTRELVRHYDGYSHLGRGIFCEPWGHSPYLSNILPPLTIPDGFFEKSIKIMVGFNERKPGWVTINAPSNLYAADTSGVDYRWMVSDIPLFWRDRISEIVYNPDYDFRTHAINRDNAFLTSTRLPMNCFNVIYDDKNNLPPLQWYEKHLKSNKL